MRSLTLISQSSVWLRVNCAIGAPPATSTKETTPLPPPPEASDWIIVVPSSASTNIIPLPAVRGLCAPTSLALSVTAPVLPLTLDTLPLEDIVLPSAAIVIPSPAISLSCLPLIETSRLLTLVLKLALRVLTLIS